MSLIFTSSNFITNIKEEAGVTQYVYTYSPIVQKQKIEKAKKIVVHMWGGGGGGGGACAVTQTLNKVVPSSGAGGGGSFTILDFPYYPTKKDIFIEVNVGKGGEGGYYLSNGRYVEAQDGGNSIVYFKDGKGRVLKEFISYGGKGGGGNGSSNNSLQRGGDGGRNTLYNGYILMGASYEQNGIHSHPKGGSSSQIYGDNCQMNYLSVSGSGGGGSANFGPDEMNHGGSFILNKGGEGGRYTDPTSNTYIGGGGGGGSTYYGKGGNGGGNGGGNEVGGDGEANSGAGGGGAISVSVTARNKGGNGGNGMVVIEVYK